MIKNLLLKLSFAILKYYGERQFKVPRDVWEIVPFAKKLCDRQDDTSAPGTSGEYKRDRVFEQLTNTYPAMTPKQLYLAILLARHDS